MSIETIEMAGALTEKFRSLQKTLNELSIDAAMYHSSLPLRDDSSRGLFNALSRIMAISDQVHMALSIMGEDVKTLEVAAADPDTMFWKEQLEDGFDEWMAAIPMSNSKVH